MTLHPDMSEAEYRALPGLSGTGVKALLESPADYRWDIDHPTPSTGAQGFGTLVHALVLGQPVRAVVSPFDSFRTKDAREWRDEQVAAGVDVVTDDDMARAEALREAVYAHPVARELLEADGQSEVSVTADHDGAPLKGRIDRLAANGLVIDLKTARDVSRGAFERSLYDYGYALQFAHYAALVGSDMRPVVIAVRNERRPAVAVHRIGEQTWHLARRGVAEAWSRYAQCWESDVWPDTDADGIRDIDMKPWGVSALENQIAGLEN